MKAVWAFDFDGVVCDSVGESSLAAWKVMAVLASRGWLDMTMSQSCFKADTFGSLPRLPLECGQISSPASNR